jgi:hypothetical protein
MKVLPRQRFPILTKKSKKMPKYHGSLKFQPGKKPGSLQMSKQTETENKDHQERGV